MNVLLSIASFFGSVPIKILIAGSFGIFAHVLIKCQSINKDTQTEDFQTVFRAFWRYDKLMVCISFVVVVFLSYASDEIVRKADAAVTAAPNTITGILGDYVSSGVKIFAFLAGLVADLLLGLVMSVTQDKLRKKARDMGIPLDQIVALPKPIPDPTPSQTQH